MIAFVDCFYSLLTSLETSGHKWLNCLLGWVFYWAAATHQVLCLLNRVGQKTIICGPFYNFKPKRVFGMNLMHENTDNISYVPILTWPGMTSSPASHVSRNDITQHFSLNSFPLLSFDTKMSHFKRRREILRADKCYGNLPFISTSESFKKTVQLKTFLLIFRYPNIIKNTLIFNVSYSVNVRFVHRVL